MFAFKLNKYDTFSPHLKLWLAVARHNFKWVKIQIIQFSARGVKGLLLTGNKYPCFYLLAVVQATLCHAVSFTGGENLLMLIYTHDWF